MSDITFIVEGSPVYAHKILLMRCSYFQALFLGQMRESRQSEIALPQVRQPVFLYILEYLYTDKLRIPLNLAMKIFVAADLFCIPRLKTMCENFMLQSITVDNAAAIFYAADLHSAHDFQNSKKLNMTLRKTRPRPKFKDDGSLFLYIPYCSVLHVALLAAFRATREFMPRENRALPRLQ